MIQMTCLLTMQNAFFIRKKFIRKWGSNRQDLKKVVRKSRDSISKTKCFIGQESVFRRYCIQNVKDGIQIQVYNINNKFVNHFSQFISIKDRKNLRKSQAQFREKLRKLRLKQNNGFLIKKRVRQHFMFSLTTRIVYKKLFYKKHEVKIRQKLRHI